MVKRNICAFPNCKKKLDIVVCLTNKCKCENIFCNDHRLPEKHNCSYDYVKNFDKQQEIEKLKCVFIRDKI